MAATTEFVAVQARLIGTELPDEPIPKLAFNRSQFFSEPIMRPSEVAGIIVRTARAMISPAYKDLTEGFSQGAHIQVHPLVIMRRQCHIRKENYPTLGSDRWGASPISRFFPQIRVV